MIHLPPLDCLFKEFEDNGDTLYATAINGVMTEVNKYQNFSGSSISAEGRYSSEKHELVLNVSINGKTKVETTNQITVVNSTSTNIFENSST